MLVIFEGVDGAGKTTLIKKLKDIYNWPEIEWPGKQKSPNAFIQMLEDFLEEHEDKIYSNEIYLMDRGGLGEIIYGTLENRLDTNADCYNYLMTIWEESVLVFCSNDQAYENAITRGEDGIAKDAIMHRTIDQAYKSVVAGCNSFSRHEENVFRDVIWYDYSDKEGTHTAEQVASLIIRSNFERIVEESK